MDDYKLPSHEQVAQLKELLENLEEEIHKIQSRFKATEQESRAETELRPDVYSEIANKNRKTKVRQFQARPLNKQAVAAAQMMELRNILQELQDRVQDTILVAQGRAYEKAKKIHEALREASKTNPSLEDAVRELDELYRQAEEEQQEGTALEDKS